MASSKGPISAPTGARLDTGERGNIWWDSPETLSGQQLKKLVQLKNAENLDDLVHHPSRLLASSEPSPASKRYQTLDYIVTQSTDNSLAKRLKAGNELQKVAIRHGDFTPLTEPFQSIGGVTVFDEVLVRRAIRSRIPESLESRENLRPHNANKFHYLERFVPSMNKEMRAFFANAQKPLEATPGLASLDRHRITLNLRTAEDIRSPTDGGYVSWRMFMKELNACTNKIVRGRDLLEFVEQSEQYVDGELNRMRLKDVVTVAYDSPHLGGTNHIVYSMSDLRQIMKEMDPELRNSERRSFLAFLRWIDILLTSISNVRLREIVSWKPLSYIRVEELRACFEPGTLNRAPSLMYQPKWRVQKSDSNVAGNTVVSDAEQARPEHEAQPKAAGGSSQMNTSDQNQLLWRRFHRDKLSGKFDRPKPLSSDIDEWRFEGSPPWLEGISKVQNRFQAVKSELSLQTVIKKTQRKVTSENAADLLNEVHDRWKKAERAKRVKHEKFLRRKKEEVFWTLRNLNWEQRTMNRKKETFIDRYHRKKDVFRVNTWFPDLMDQCKVVMGTVKPMKLVERLASISWEHFNFALERLALLICSMSSRDLTNFQMHSAAQFILREVLGGPEDLISRCYRFRKLPEELPFLRPGRGGSLITELEQLAKRPKHEDLHHQARAADREAPIKFASTIGMTSENLGAPLLKRPLIDIRGSMKPISLLARARLPSRS